MPSYLGLVLESGLLFGLLFLAEALDLSQSYAFRGRRSVVEFLKLGCELSQSCIKLEHECLKLVFELELRQQCLKPEDGVILHWVIKYVNPSGVVVAVLGEFMMDRMEHPRRHLGRRLRTGRKGIRAAQTPAARGARAHGPSGSDDVFVRS